MSTPKPDGSDPRVLAPSEDEPVVTVKSAFGGSGEAYHTENCINVQRMRESREVKLSIAEWKGYHECENCIELREAQNEPEPDPEPEPEPDLSGACADVRKDLANGMDKATVAENSPWEKRSTHRHATGKCSHDIDVPPVSYGWYFDSRVADTASVRDIRNDNISRGECAEIRRRLVNGASLKSLESEFHITNDGVSYHAKGECGHAHSEVAAVSHGWHPV